ncbi:hypothetical protein [Ferruginibacter albus]|uniref:hypothetical protein n=1 Tax=Ferruginibacter albus TaxID=2875540 RepID=UPI001CC67330|nr:hypothetical protein [Ferruginibacter albus]UAY53633.1 hypothetical protein K9M53_08185 [Ferruginibacter albus]
MKKTFLAFVVIVILLSCKQKTGIVFPAQWQNDTLQQTAKAKANIVNNLAIDNTYQFDSTAIVSGCGMVALQKISKDYRYELIIELILDSIPKYKQFSIVDFRDHIKITLNQYSKDNKLINDICTDTPVYSKDQKEPITFTAIEGLMTITNIDGKHSPFKISLTTNNLVFQNADKETFLLPKEEFKDVLVGWYAG